MAPVIMALRREEWADCRVLATAQHREMLDSVLDFFGIDPDRDLDLMQHDQLLADLTSRMIAATDAVFDEERPDLVIAQGDTTTVMTAALCAFYRRIRFAHVEAGLRSGNPRIPFPEEANRAITARLAAVHFAPTDHARMNLLREGVLASNVHVVGNPVVDALLWTKERVEEAVLQPDGRRLVLVTVHRREHFGEPFERIARALRAIADRGDVDLLYPVHPNPNVRSAAQRLLEGHERIELVEPLDYPDMVAAMQAATLIMTDSGGLQEEAPSLDKPVLVMRDETERIEGIAAGTARLVGTDPERIVASATELLDDPSAYQAMAAPANPYGSGDTAERIVEILRGDAAGISG